MAPTNKPSATSEKPDKSPEEVDVPVAPPALSDDALTRSEWARISTEAFGVPPEIALNAVSGDEPVTRGNMRDAIAAFLAKPITTEG